MIVRTDISRPKPRTLHNIDNFDADDDETDEELRSDTDHDSDKLCQEESADEEEWKQETDMEAEAEDDEEDAVAQALESTSTHPLSTAANSGVGSTPGPASCSDPVSRMRFLQGLNGRVEYQEMLLRVEDQVSR